MTPCQHRTLARNPVGQVQECTACGVISLHIGAVTLRIDAGGAESLWALLGDALHELHESRSTPPFRGHA